MNKLELAHDMALAMQNREPIVDMKIVAALSFDYAEAMLAENEKRKDKPTLTSLQQNFIDGVEQPRYAPCVEEWQPDWSQAPEGANWWAMDFDGSANWFSYEPYVSSEYPNEWIYNGRNHGGLGIEYWRAMPFDYKGGWQDSLRKRP